MDNKSEIETMYTMLRTMFPIPRWNLAVNETNVEFEDPEDPIDAMQHIINIQLKSSASVSSYILYLDTLNTASEIFVTVEGEELHKIFLLTDDKKKIFVLGTGETFLNIIRNEDEVRFCPRKKIKPWYVATSAKDPDDQNIILRTKYMVLIEKPLRDLSIWTNLLSISIKDAFVKKLDTVHTPRNLVYFTATFEYGEDITIDISLSKKLKSCYLKNAFLKGIDTELRMEKLVVSSEMHVGGSDRMSFRLDGSEEHPAKISIACCTWCDKCKPSREAIKNFWVKNNEKCFVGIRNVFLNWKNLEMNCRVNINSKDILGFSMVTKSISAIRFTCNETRKCGVNIQSENEFKMELYNRGGNQPAFFSFMKAEKQVGSGYFAITNEF